MFPSGVPMERNSPSPEPMVYSFIHSYPSESPVMKTSHENRENIRSQSTEPHADGRLSYNGVRPGTPRGSFTTLSLPQCHAAFRTIPSTLAWVDQSPVGQRVS